MVRPLRSLGRKTEPRTVLAHGCFDVLHLGHKRHLEEARGLGDRLVVSITPDHLVNKGPGRPVFPAEKRRALLMELRCVDMVLLADNAEHAIRMVRPHIYCKGREYAGNLPEEALVREFGGHVVYTDGPVHSSTALVPLLEAA